MVLKASFKSIFDFPKLFNAVFFWFPKSYFLAIFILKLQKSDFKNFLKLMYQSFPRPFFCKITDIYPKTTL